MGEGEAGAGAGGGPGGEQADSVAAVLCGPSSHVSSHSACAASISSVLLKYSYIRDAVSAPCLHLQIGVKPEWRWRWR